MKKFVIRTIQFGIVAVFLINFFMPSATADSTSGDTIFEVSWSAKSSWETISYVDSITLDDIAFGDFNGDGTTDVFYADGSTWYVRYGGQGEWEKLETSQHTVEDLRFGDFNGDGITDVFLNTPKAWKVSWGGITKWETIATDDLAHNYWIAFGDFNGDGTTDVFLASGPDAWDDVIPCQYFYPRARTWYVRYGAVGEWKKICTSNYTVPKLKFGDFNGDGITDVFLNTYRAWKVAWSGRNSWETIATKDIVHYNNHIAFGDFNNDGCDDVFYGDREVCRVRYSAQGDWETYGSSKFMVEDLGFGDFDGDGITDVFHLKPNIIILSLTIDSEPTPTEEEPITEPVPTEEEPITEPVPTEEEPITEPINPEPESEQPADSETVKKTETTSIYLPIAFISIVIISILGVLLFTKKLN